MDKRCRNKVIDELIEKLTSQGRKFCGEAYHASFPTCSIDVDFNVNPEDPPIRIIQHFLDPKQIPEDYPLNENTGYNIEYVGSKEGLYVVRLNRIPTDTLGFLVTKTDLIFHLQIC